MPRGYPSGALSVHGCPCARSRAQVPFMTKSRSHRGTLAPVESVAGFRGQSLGTFEKVQGHVLRGPGSCTGCYCGEPSGQQGPKAALRSLSCHFRVGDTDVDHVIRSENEREAAQVKPAGEGHGESRLKSRPSPGAGTRVLKQGLHLPAGLCQAPQIQVPSE